MTDQACSTCGNPAVRLLGGQCRLCSTDTAADFDESLANRMVREPRIAIDHAHVDRRGAHARAQATLAGHSVLCAQFGADPECPGSDGDPRAPLLDIDDLLEQRDGIANDLRAVEYQRDAALAQLDAVRAQLAAERTRYLKDRGALHRAEAERDAALARTETAERELAALRPPPAPERPQVAPFCFGCGEEHGGCVCPWSGGRS